MARFSVSVDSVYELIRITEYTEKITTSNINIIIRVLFFIFFLFGIKNTNLFDEWCVVCSLVLYENNNDEIPLK